MALKSKTKRRILYGILTLVGVAIIGIVTIPPMFTLNRLKPRLVAALETQTGVRPEINGDIHFSLLGHPTIVARDITVPAGKIGAASFSVPLAALFDLSRARLNGEITIYDADVKMDRLSSVGPEYDLILNNCNINFLDKDYRIISGTVRSGQFRGIVRTDQHKYDISMRGDEFYVTNKNNNLVIVGNLTESGGARGTMSLTTDNVNRMFEFDTPRLPGRYALEMKFDWDGGYGVNFTDIIGDNFTGSIDIQPDGRRTIKLNATDVTFDFSFLLHPTKLIYDAQFDLDIRGDLKLANKKFHHMIIQAAGRPGELNITKIVADDNMIKGGDITADGAHNLAIATTIHGAPASCMFSGTPKKWECSTFTYRDMRGTINVDGDTFTATVSGTGTMPSEHELRKILPGKKMNGVIDFLFTDAAGTLYIKGGKFRPRFKFARDRKLTWMRGDLEFIPAFMKNEIGDFSLSDSRVTFRPHNGRWELTTDGDAFVISGKSAHDWFQEMDLRAIADSDFFVSGIRRGDAISNLTIRVLGHEFTGSASGRNITLKTDVLNLDAFTKQSFWDNYDEMEFLTDAPIMLPFGLGVNISLTADTLIINGNEYHNFVYSLKPDTQTYSITDSLRGAALAIITKNKREYDISVQLAKFKTDGSLLAPTMPLNVRDTTITGEAHMHTSGKIAHDIAYNLAGELDMTLTGGTLIGIGTDAFYADAENITRLNAEYAIARALDGGETALKEMQITGTFSGNDFSTTSPFTISMRHADAFGTMQIRDNMMTATMNILMRATSPDPTRIAVSVAPDGKRRYSLSEIMMNLDPTYMRVFIENHNRF